jgi:hypothetical protein
MAKVKSVQTTDYMNVCYRLDDKQSGDTIKSIDMNWYNRSEEEVMENLNTWLLACGFKLKVIPSRWGTTDTPE